jgi:dihydrofolate reductase
MRRLIVTENITADGRIEMLDDWFDPSRTDQDVGDLEEEMTRQGSETDGLLVGRQTFLDFRGYWPQHTDTPTGAHLEAVQKYVVSRSLTDPEWRNTTILAGDPVDEVRALKETEGGDIVLTGSIRLTHAVLAAGLADELRLFVYPAIQGRGAGLVADGTRLPDLTLLEARAFRAGVTMLRYAVPAG